MSKEILKKLDASKKAIDSRSKTYGNAWAKIGPILKSFFPDGVNLKTEKDFENFANFFWCVAKMNRLSNNISEIHKDSAIDLISYAAMLANCARDEK